MLIRRATTEDATAIAAIHVRSWQAAYRGIIPDDYLDHLSVDERAIRWRELLDQGVPSVSVVADPEGIRGWIAVAGSRDPDAHGHTAELWAIYVDPAYWRRGLGRTLWSEAKRDLLNAGYTEVTVWVLQANELALRFYRSVGFEIQPGLEKTIERGDTELVEVCLLADLR